MAPQKDQFSPEQYNGLGDLEPAVASPLAWLHKAMSVSREQGSIKVNGCNIRYYRWGNPDKPGVVMLHGFLSNARCFAFIAPYLANDYHVIAYDMSGMGDSGWRTEYNNSNRVQELLGVCEQTGLFDNARQPTIIAHSYGGRIGTAAVQSHPQQFSGLIICDLLIMRPSIIEAFADKVSPPGSGRNPDRPNRIYPSYEEAKKRFVLSPPQSVEHPPLLDFMAYHSLKEVDGGWQWKFDPTLFKSITHAESPWAKTADELIAVPGRKAVIYGLQSLLFIRDSVDYLNELAAEHKTPRIPCIGIPDAHHHLMLDQPIAFASTLKSVLSLWANE